MVRYRIVAQLTRNSCTDRQDSYFNGQLATLGDECMRSQTSLRPLMDTRPLNGLGGYIGADVQTMWDQMKEVSNEEDIRGIPETERKIPADL